MKKLYLITLKYSLKKKKPFRLFYICSKNILIPINIKNNPPINSTLKLKYEPTLLPNITPKEEIIKVIIPINKQVK